MKSKKSNVCVLCGVNDASTVDHIPPKGIFLKPLPENLITVPACEQCNNGSSQDDILFQMLLAIAVGSKTDAGKNFWKKAIRIFQYPNNTNLRKSIRSKLGCSSLNTPAGLYLGEVSTINFTSKEIRPVIEKITKGLYFQNTGKILSSDAEIDISDIKQFSGFNGDVFEMCSPYTITKSFRDEFSFKFGVANDAENSSIGFYQFYNSFFVTVITLDKQYDENKHPKLLQKT